MIAHSRPTLPTETEWADVTSRLADGWAADGPCVQQFESTAAHWLGASGGLAVNSGSTALLLAVKSLNLPQGSQVAVPAYCCAALLNALDGAGVQPLLVDVEPGGYHLSVDDLKSRWNAAVGAIVLVHLFGDPMDVAPFRQFGVPIIEDCAQSIGASQRNRRTGSDGDLAISSFYATKVLTTGHGGLVTARQPDLLRAATDLTEYDNRDEWRPRFSVGMSEIQAALGLWQLERLPGFLARRREIAHFYREQFQLQLGICAANGHAPAAEPIYFRFVLRARSADEAFRALQSRGVDAKRPVYRPLHHYLGGDFPASEAAHAEIVSLPIYPALTDAEVEQVSQAVLETARHWI